MTMSVFKCDETQGISNKYDSIGFLLLCKLDYSLQNSLYNSLKLWMVFMLLCYLLISEFAEFKRCNFLYKIILKSFNYNHSFSVCVCAGVVSLNDSSWIISNFKKTIDRKYAFILDLKLNEKKSVS